MKSIFFSNVTAEQIRAIREAGRQICRSIQFHQKKKRARLKARAYHNPAAFAACS